MVVVSHHGLSNLLAVIDQDAIQTDHHVQTRLLAIPASIGDELFGAILTCRKGASIVKPSGPLDLQNQLNEAA